jgi:Ca2+-binding EF-hand superfamily protein
VSHHRIPETGREKDEFNDEEMKTIFKALDLDGSGGIDSQELAKVSFTCILGLF